MTTSSHLTSRRLSEHERIGHTAGLFGIRYLWVESYAFDTASSLCPEYDGGLWDFYVISNGGFYIVPAEGAAFQVVCANGFEGKLSAEAFGITVCLYAYSLLSFSPDADFAEKCATHYHLLRHYMLSHSEAPRILAAID
ncbi:antirestriction protein [Ramlibacter alkalitolerans]|uniref:Antirestriction protein n=1 Tax=Ramlibacter alkalitolerans TaxID=2039631 RepID=A0ABS1JWR6_9BURK|nr:antirestriction protein [Ramlibacter alkalitolerans]MBL0428724.1 antirestriction protein [Ramlibacter alkalitolerans]